MNRSYFILKYQKSVCWHNVAQQDCVRRCAKSMPTLLVLIMLCSLVSIAPVIVIMTCYIFVSINLSYITHNTLMTKWAKEWSVSDDQNKFPDPTDTVMRCRRGTRPFVIILLVTLPARGGRMYFMNLVSTIGDREIRNWGCIDMDIAYTEGNPSDMALTRNNNDVLGLSHYPPVQSRISYFLSYRKSDEQTSSAKFDRSLRKHWCVSPDIGRFMDNTGRENLIIAVMLSIFLFALIFGGDARRFDMGRPWKFPSKESVARAKAFLDDNPVVDGYSQS